MVCAQVTVELKLPQEQFLPAEDIWVAVRVYNRSGTTLRFGETADWLKISVLARDGYIVEKVDEIPVLGVFTLENGQVGTRRINIRPYFKLTTPGRYQIYATVRVKEWNEEYSAAPVWFDIIQGRKLWEQEFGVPQTASNTPPEMRRYALQQANYLRQLKLYFRLESGDGSVVYRVFPLGSIVSFGLPEAQIDRSSRLHVLFQNTARTFTYCVLDHDGELIRRETYDYVDVRPRLKLDNAGEVVVQGGLRRVSPTDILPGQPSGPTVGQSNLTTGSFSEGLGSLTNTGAATPVATGQ